jgi:hypothetical protein
VYCPNTQKPSINTTPIAEANHQTTLKFIELSLRVSRVKFQHFWSGVRGAFLEVTVAALGAQKQD